MKSDIAVEYCVESCWAQIDWQRPWLTALREAGERIAAQVLRGASVADALNAAQKWGIRKSRLMKGVSTRLPKVVG